MVKDVISIYIWFIKNLGKIPCASNDKPKKQVKIRSYLLVIPCQCVNIVWQMTNGCSFCTAKDHIGILFPCGFVLKPNLIQALVRKTVF